jgi:DNA-binding PadR family transcriptional regulator
MPKTKIDNIMRDFLLGIIRLHILHHAQKEPVFGLELIRELATHGYELSPGTLYPILHSLEEHGFLASEKKVVNGKARKYYRATAAGAEALAMGRVQVLELLDEIGLNPTPSQHEVPAIE